VPRAARRAAGWPVRTHAVESSKHLGRKKNSRNAFGIQSSGSGATVKSVGNSFIGMASTDSSISHEYCSDTTTPHHMTHHTTRHITSHATSSNARK
jgi:hypothetical protein